MLCFNINKVSWNEAATFSILILGMVGCSTSAQLPEQGTPAQEIFVRQCTQCHSLPHPGRHTPEQWDHVLGMMVGFMKERKVAYSKQDMHTIRDYLHRNAR